MAIYLASRFSNYIEINTIITPTDPNTLQEMKSISKGKWFIAICDSVTNLDEPLASKAIGNSYLVFKGMSPKNSEVVVAPCPPFCNSDAG